MTVYSLADRKLALGLKWLPPGAIPAGAGAGRKARELAAMKPPPVGFVQLETAGGPQLGATTDQADIGLQSGAAWLAQAQLSAVLVERLADNLYWLCATEDSAIFPAGDMVGGKDLIAARLDEIRTDIAGSDICMYDKTGSFGLTDAEPLDFSDLAAGFDAAADILCQPTRSRNLKKPLAVLATVLLITASGYGARSLYLSYMDASFESDQDVQTQRQTRRLNDERKLLHQELEQNAPALLATLADTISGRPLRAAGWRATQYEWSGNQVTATWRREHGSMAGIAEHLGSAQFSLDEKTGQVVEQFEFPAPLLSDTAPLEDRLGGLQERMALIDLMAYLPGKWSLQLAKAAGKHYPIRRSAFSGEAETLHAAIEIARVLRSLPIRIKTVTISLEKPHVWNIEGDYYAKNN